MAQQVLARVHFAASREQSEGHGHADRHNRTAPDRGIEHFFHRSSVRGAVFELLREGQRVEFTPEESQKGPRAGDVRLIES
jgi:cold shock CspA family protein